MSELPRLLVLLLPGGWEAAPAELGELRRCLAEEFSAALQLRQGTGLMTAPLPFFAGYWPGDLYRVAQQEVLPLVGAAFFTLDWLDVDGVV